MKDPVEVANVYLPEETELAVLSSVTRRSAKLIALFLRQIPIELTNLDRAIRARDEEQVRQLAHKLKGSCRAVGALQMAVACEMLERSLDEGGGAASEHDRIVAEYARVQAMLEREQATAPR